MKFTYGDSVVVKGDSPTQFRPEQCGAIVGLYQIQDDDVAKMRGHQVGTVIYTVEFPDGADLEIPENLLEIPDFS